MALFKSSIAFSSPDFAAITMQSSIYSCKISFPVLFKAEITAAN